MDALMRALVTKKHEALQLQAEKKPSEKYLRCAEVETRRLEREATEQLHLAASKSGLPCTEIKRRLRDFGEQMTLFCESARACAWTAAEHAVGATSFEGHDDDDDDDSGGEQRTRRAGGHGSSSDSAHGTGRCKRKAAKPAPTALDGDASGDESDERDLDKLVYRVFKAKLQAWERDLAARLDHVKRTAQGKIPRKTMKQCKDYIRLLFKLFKQQQVPPDILPNLAEIVRFCRHGEFVLANDVYIKFAIRNVAWPIGVTTVVLSQCWSNTDQLIFESLLLAAPLPQTRAGTAAAKTPGKPLLKPPAARKR
ncbi:hypothetical protein PybrP1_006421 [[Pythium] brassicae (nom. inval.)]|nr:hypothetical protein PybrP1_006421 [[Pythium] brassicae (nom. inval.)]